MNYYRACGYAVLAGLIMMVFLCLVSGCSTAEYRPEAPRVKIWAILGGSLWRKQDKAILGLPLAEGYFCVSPDDMEKLMAVYSESLTLPAR